MQEQRGERACTGSSRQRLRPLRSLLRRLTPKAACGCWPSSQRQSVRGASARCCESCGPRRAFRHGRGSQDARRVHAEREGKRGPESICSPRGAAFSCFHSDVHTSPPSLLIITMASPPEPLGLLPRSAAVPASEGAAPGRRRHRRRFQAAAPSRQHAR
jgi:hypothetical protein